MCCESPATIAQAHSGSLQQKKGMSSRTARGILRLQGIALGILKRIQCFWKEDVFQTMFIGTFCAVWAQATRASLRDLRASRGNAFLQPRLDKRHPFPFPEIHCDIRFRFSVVRAICP